MNIRDFKDRELGVPEGKVHRLPPGEPRKGLISRLTVNISQMCEGCLHNSSTGCIPMRQGRDAPCSTSDGSERDFSSGQMFSAALLEE